MQKILQKISLFPIENFHPLCYDKQACFIVEKKPLQMPLAFAVFHKNNINSMSIASEDAGKEIEIC